MATLQEQIQELNSYPSCAHVSPQKLASIFGQLQSANGTVELLNINDESDVNSKLSTLTHAGNYGVFVICGDDGKFPSSSLDSVMSEASYKLLHGGTKNKAVVQLMQNWEAYYKVASYWYSQNIRKYLKPEAPAVPHVLRTGDMLIVALHEVKVSDLLDKMVDFSSLNISNEMTNQEKLLWDTYKYTIGCNGFSDEATIKAMLEKGLIFSSVDNTEYEQVPKTVLMYDYVLICNEQTPLPVFTGEFNSGNDCDKPGIYNKITLGRPAGSVSGETYTLITHPDGSQEVRSNMVAGKAFYRPTKMDEWVQLGIN